MIVDNDARANGNGPQNASIHLSGSIAATGGFYFRGGDGDVNGSGGVSIADVLLVRSYVAGGQAFSVKQRQSADVDGDGRITLRDAELIHYMVSGGGDSDPAVVDRIRRESRHEADVIASTRTHGGSGDASGDGTVTAGDTSVILSYLDGSASLSPLARARADVNGDGRVDRGDAERAMLKIGSGGAYNHAEAQRGTDAAYFTTNEGHFSIGKHVTSVTTAQLGTCNEHRRGALALDTTNHRLAVCSATGWRSAQLQTP